MTTVSKVFAVYFIAVAAILTGCDSGKPPLPIKLTTRHAALTGNRVAIIKNTGDQTLSLRAKFKNSSFNQSKVFNIVLSPWETQEIGSLEGWDVLPGETVHFSCDGYASASYTFLD